MSELISIIVPVYNIKEYLERCVDSILAQTYENIEVLLVDDGSTDGTSLLVDTLGKKDNRIRVFHKENGGSSSARNLGIREAKGDYLGFIDSDDYIEPYMFEQLYEALQRTGMPIAQGSREEIDEQGNILPDICIPPEREIVYPSKDFMKELLLHKGDCSFCTKLTDARLFGVRKSDDREQGVGEGVAGGQQEGFRFPEGALNEDFHVLVQMLPKIKGIVCIPERTYHVFYKSGSNTRVKDENTFSRVYGDNVDNADMVLKIVEREYPDLKTIALRFGLYQRLDYLLHIPISQMTRANQQYQDIVRYLKKHRMVIRRNPELTKKQKLYLQILSIAPKRIRQMHKMLRK